ncbi:MAG: single-stranded-DNA-specific exonuclease RecJ [Verrucomicrobiota bacterium]|nr:single-stranded-DNA-specific exonuclease RecJ [Verrucomicrobiota bacterium]
MRWNSSSVNDAEVGVLSARLGISQPTATILWRLGIRTKEEAETFLDPKLRSLEDPFLITHLEKAVLRLRQAMAREEKIVVFGDYDVDGVTSTAFLVSILNVFGIHPRFIVPRRLEEGYGLSLAALERVLDGGKPDLLIAVDCGTNSHVEVAHLRERGVDVIILDHHVSKSNHPADCILVNPHVFDGDDRPWTDLCTVGLVFKFIHGLLKQLRADGDGVAEQIQLKDYLDFVALGTIADLVPLRGENRILARAGLSRLRETLRPGINALFEVSKIKLGEDVTPWDISFRLGPRINASGRLNDATVPIDMLLSTDWKSCLGSARMLDDFNRERQEIERSICLQAEEMVENGMRDSAGLVLFNSEWHPGVVGIVASRISQKYYRPTLVLGAEGALAKGSGRSIAGMNLVEILTPCTHLLSHWGGHPMAVGIALSPTRMDMLRTLFAESVLRLAKGGTMPEPMLDITCWMQPKDIGARLMDELDRLSPFGQGNPEPIFGLKGVCLRQSPQPFGVGNFRFNLDNGANHPISGVAWKKGEKVLPTGRPVDLAVKLAWNFWNDRKTLQMTLVDWRE